MDPLPTARFKSFLAALSPFGDGKPEKIFRACLHEFSEDKFGKFVRAARKLLNLAVGRGF